MNRRARRASKAQGHTETWKRGIETVHRESAGVLELIIVQPAEMFLLMFDGLCGDRRAKAIAIAVADAVHDITAAAETPLPKLCGSCPTELRNNAYTVILALPQRDDPTTAVAMAICEACGTTEASIREKATEAFRSLWPMLRPITVHPHGGRA